MSSIAAAAKAARQRLLALAGLAALLFVATGAAAAVQQQQQQQQLGEQRQRSDRQRRQAAARASRRRGPRRSRRPRRSRSRSRPARRSPSSAAASRRAPSRGRSCSRAPSRSAGRSSQVGTDGSPEKVQNAIQAAIRNGSNAVILNAADKDALAEADLGRQGQGRRVRDLLLARHAGPGRALQHRERRAERPDRRHARGQGRRATAAARPTRCLRQRLGLRRSWRPSARRSRRKYKELCADCKSAQDRHPADVARQGRSGPHRLLPAQPPERELRRRCPSPAPSAPASRPRCRAAGLATRSRSSARAATSRPTRTSTPARSPPSRRRRCTATTTRCSTRSPASGPASRSSRRPPEFWLMTKRPMPTSINGPAFPIVQDYQTQWAKLWGKAARAEACREEVTSAPRRGRRRCVHARW